MAVDDPDTHAFKSGVTMALQPRAQSYNIRYELLVTTASDSRMKYELNNIEIFQSMEKNVIVVHVTIGMST
jgi:hypothetical protein